MRRRLLQVSAAVLLAAGFGISRFAGEVPGESGWTELIAWVLWLEGCSLALFPYVRLLFPRSPDQGWMAAKWLGLMAPAYLGWLGALSWETGLAGPGAGVVIIGLAMSLLPGFDSSAEAAAGSYDRKAWILTGELLFWVAFLLFLVLRLINPEIWHPGMGGEKPMDLAILSSLVRDAGCPPPDPWFSGYLLNYYYFGYVPFAWLSQVLSVPPSVAFNLALPTVAALSAGIAFVLVATLGVFTRGSAKQVVLGSSNRFMKPASALWGPLLVVGIGNLFEPLLLLSGLRQIGSTPVAGSSPAWMPLNPLGEVALGLARFLAGEASWPYSWTSLYWSATRIIPAGAGEAQPISEFPFFSLLFGDLHPHLMALPGCLFFLFGLCSVYTWRARPALVEGLKPALASGFSLGVVVMTNPWDLPLAGLLLLGFAALPLVGEGAKDRPPLLRAVLFPSGVVLLAGLLTATPFFQHYRAPVGGIALWKGSGTSTEAFLLHFGLFVLLLAGFFYRQLLGEPGQIRRKPSAKALLWAFLTVAGSVVLVACGLASGASMAAAMLAGLSAGAVIRLRWGPARLVALLCLAGCGLVLVPEVFCLVGDVGRMNLVFKLHYGAFWLWAIASALILANWQQLGPPGRTWRVALVLALALSLCFLPFSILGKAMDRVSTFTLTTLDGLASMEQVRFLAGKREVRLAGDLAIIRWLGREIQGTPVLLEAVTPDYGPGGRLSAATGIPTLLGWPNHLAQHRRGSGHAGEMEARWEAVRRIYQASGTPEVLDLIQRYHVELVVFGELEREIYGVSGEDKFRDEKEFWEPVHASGRSRLYRIRVAAITGSAPPE